jgi:hypothetical protein
MKNKLYMLIFVLLLFGCTEDIKESVDITIPLLIQHMLLKMVLIMHYTIK